MPFLKVDKNFSRVFESKSISQKTVYANSEGIFVKNQILNTPGFLSGSNLAIEEGNRGALERIPGTLFINETLSGESVVYNGGHFNALHPYDEEREPIAYTLQSSSFMSGDEFSTFTAQRRQHIQNVYMPMYASKYGPRYENSVLNQKVLALSRPVLTPSYLYNENYDISNGISAFAHFKVCQDDIGSDQVFEFASSGFSGVSPPADISMSSGLSPVLSILSGSWSGFASGSNNTNLNTLTGLQVPFVCFSFGVNRDSEGNRRLYILAATGSGQTDVFQYQSDALDINLNEWNHIGVRWQRDINDSTGSFVLNGRNVGEFSLDSPTLSMPNPSSWITSSYSYPLISSSFEDIGAISSSIDGLITLGNTGQYRLSGTHISGFNYPYQMGSAKLVEMHDVTIFNKFVELEDIEPYISGNVSYTDSLNPVFYMPLIAPRNRVLPSVNSSFASSGLTNVLSYYGGTENYFGGFYIGDSKIIYMEEPHILSVAQLGGNINSASPTLSSLDILHLGGDIPKTIWCNASAGSESGVFWNKNKSPLLGFGAQWMQNLPLVDIANGNFSLPVFIGSGTIEGSDRVSFIPSNPMDLIVNNTSASYAPSTMRIWPSDNHSFILNGENLNTFLSNLPSGNLIDEFYQEFEFRTRHDAAIEADNIIVKTSYVNFLTNSIEYNSVQGDLYTDCNHFTNTSQNSNVLLYIPKVISGDLIKTNSVDLYTQPLVFGLTSRYSFGDIYSTYGDVSVDDYVLSFKDNGYGGIYRGNIITNGVYNTIGCIFYDRGLFLQIDPTMFWFGYNGSFEDYNYWSMTFSSINNAYIKESEYTIPKNIARYSEFDEVDTITGINIFDINGNCLEKINIAQPVSRLSGSAITIKSYMVY